ncbi:MAG TPA: DUF3996 domain-containing protein [Kofleriaceae bacterium]|nr:DUF3996 domain-containing protein [Kofleriaceae bacterium]
MTGRNLLLALVATFGLAALPTAAHARPRPEGHLGGRRFEANKTFGLGLELGAPTGVTGKYFLAADRAIDFGVGDIYNYFDRSGLHIYMDYLWHPVSLASSADFELPLYIGVGGRFWNFSRRFDNAPDDNAYAFGIRVPVGVSFDFNNIPIDVFVQLVPVLDFFANYAAHSIYLDLDASIGVRYWFN